MSFAPENEPAVITSPRLGFAYDLMGRQKTAIRGSFSVLKDLLVTRGYFVRETRPAWQLVEVLRRFDLVTRAAPFSRCLRCNSRLQAEPKDRVAHLLPARTREYYGEFSQCPDCARIYWQGSHYTQMRVFLEKAFAVALGNRGGGRA